MGLVQEPQQPGVVGLGERAGPPVAVELLEPLRLPPRHLVRLVDEQHPADRTQGVLAVLAADWRRWGPGAHPRWPRVVAVGAWGRSSTRTGAIERPAAPGRASSRATRRFLGYGVGSVGVAMALNGLVILAEQRRPARSCLSNERPTIHRGRRRSGRVIEETGFLLHRRATRTCLVLQALRCRATGHLGIVLGRGNHRGLDEDREIALVGALEALGFAARPGGWARRPRRRPRRRENSLLEVKSLANASPARVRAKIDASADDDELVRVLVADGLLKALGGSSRTQGGAGYRRGDPRSVQRWADARYERADRSSPGRGSDRHCRGRVGVVVAYEL